VSTRAAGDHPAGLDTVLLTQPRRLPSRAFVPVLGSCCLIATTAYLLVFTLLGQIGASFRASDATVDWIAITTLTVGTVSAGLFPALGSQFGYRRLLVLAMGCLAVGSAVGSLAPDLAVVFVGRIVAACGLAAVALSVAIVRQHLPEEALAGALGVIAGFEGLAAATGFALGGVVETAFASDWRAVFAVLAAIAAVGGAGAYAVVPGAHLPATPGPPASRPRSARLDLVGAVLLAASLVALMLPITEGDSWGWSSLRTVGLLVAGAVLAAAFVLAELRAPVPLVAIRVCRRPLVAVGLALCAAMGATTGILNITVPPFVEAPAGAGYGFGDSVLEAGLVMLPAAAAITAAGLAGGLLARRLASARSIAVAGMVLEAASMSLLAAFHHSLGEVVPIVALFGVGHGSMVFSSYSIVVRAVARRDAGTVTGLTGIASGIGGAVATAGATSLLVSRLVEAARQSLPAASGYVHAWVLAALLAAGGVALAGAATAVRRAGPS